MTRYKSAARRARGFSCMFAFIVLSVAATMSFGQSEGCKLELTEKVKYEIVQSFKSTLPPYARSLRIVVTRENFNREFMTCLAMALHDQFCEDDEISAMIFDDKHVARTMDQGEYLMGRIKVPEVRGFYGRTRDRSAKRGGEESIEFSTKRGNPTNEVIVKLSPN